MKNWRQHSENHPFLKGYKFYCEIYGFAVYENYYLSAYDIVCDLQYYDKIRDYLIAEYLEPGGEWIILAP